MNAPKQLPLLFSFGQLIVGNGFLAGVAMSGRALLEEEGKEIWISGVAPVGFAAGGPDRATAFIAFRQAWNDVLVDIAAESGDFETFRRHVDAFLQSSADSTTKVWMDALAEIRRSNYSDPGLKRVVDADKKAIEGRIEDLSHLAGSDANETGFKVKQAA